MIYLLHDDAATCAQMLDDKALGLQIKQIAQVLCQIHFQWIDYKAETFGHAQVLADQIPIYDRTVFDKRRNDYADWGYQCRANYARLVEMGLACCAEYIWRFSNAKKGYTRKNAHDFFIGYQDKFYIRKRHKLQHVIEWCKLNIPELPVNYKNDSIEVEINEERETALSPTFKEEPTPFPLCVPEKYHVYYHIDACFPTITELHIVDSYRNYYRAKLEKQFVTCKGCQSCEFKGDHYISAPTWTRRNRPNI